MNFIIVQLKDEIINNIIDTEYLSKIFSIYSELTDSKEISYINFKNIITSLPEKHQIYVYKYNNKPVGLITLMIENKLIHSGGLVGHIEDLAIDKEYRNMSIGKTLIEYCIDISRKNGCYKVILNCNNELKKYYEKNNFVNTGCFMTYRIF
tara:strand:+ start:6358 stop:6810 length:453 start_codon:yes stop_codon:yes gene_type:complete